MNFKKLETVLIAVKSRRRIYMSIRLGNLKTNEVLERLGVQLSKEDFKKLDDLRDDLADVPKGKWHGFDIPFQIVCGDRETAKTVVKFLSPYADNFKTQIQIDHK